MTGHGYMTPNTTTSQHGEFNQLGPSFPAPRYQPNPNLFDPQCANPMLPGPSMPLRDQQWTDYQLPMSNQVPAMLPGPQPPMNQWHQYSNIHQPQPGHGYMTPNATTSQHGGFNQNMVASFNLDLLFLLPGVTIFLIKDKSIELL
uniref:Uncharacterized protein n=1 Tax=Populus davidiana TaxID=266767 RepID=A0A6M2ENQ9_9ROSI